MINITNTSSHVNDPPVVLPVNNEKIPTPLKRKDTWVKWKVGASKPDGKYDKLPMNAFGIVTNAHDPNNQMSFDIAYSGYEQGKCSGVGFVLNGKPFTTDGDGDLYLVGIDIDRCVTKDGNGNYILSDDANDAWLKLGKPYLEVSPSDTGVRMFVYSRQLISSGNKDGHEIYCNGRFLTITGQQQGSGNIIEATDGVIKLHSVWFPDKQAVKSVSLSNSLQGLKLPPPETEMEISRLKAALPFLSADTSYDIWRNLVWAIKSTGWGCAEQIAREWSKTAPSRYSDEGFQAVWNSFDSSRGITEATLYYQAKQAGWVPPNKAQQDLDEGDILNGRLYASAYRDKVLFIYENGNVLMFDSESGWVHASPFEAERLAKVIVDQLMMEANQMVAADPDSGIAKRKLAHARKSSMEPRINAMIGMAKSELGMTVRLSEFDRDNYLIGLTNGILDIRKRQLLPITPQILVSMRTNVAYVEGSKCPLWIKFLNKVQPDKAVQRLLQQLVGAFLTGDVGIQKLIIFYGLGANGKSTFIELLSFLLGDYSQKIQTEMLMEHKKSPQGPSPDLVSLKGRRLVFCNEVPESGRLDAARARDLSGGDTITGRAPYAKEAITFQPTHKLVMVGNHRPEISDTVEGMWRRVLLISFDVMIPVHERDPNLLVKLKAEGSGILNWAIAGFNDLQRNGLLIPKCITAAVDAYKDEEDLLGEWLTDHCDLAPSNTQKIYECYIAYKGWAQHRGNMPLAQGRLNKRLKSRGIQLDKGRRNYIGLKLNDFGEGAYRCAVI